MTLKLMRTTDWIQKTVATDNNMTNKNTFDRYFKLSITDGT